MSWFRRWMKANAFAAVSLIMLTTTTASAVSVAIRLNRVSQTEQDVADLKAQVRGIKLFLATQLQESAPEHQAELAKIIESLKEKQ